MELYKLLSRKYKESPTSGPVDKVTFEKILAEVETRLSGVEQNTSFTEIVTGGLDKNMNWGINLISSSFSGNTIRLPYPPIKGRKVTVVNNSGYIVYIRPSVSGGSINGVVDGTAAVPSDGKTYDFSCWENPLPGAWSWLPPATAQFDSGILSHLSPASNGALSGSKPGNEASSSSMHANLCGFDGLNTAQFLTYSDGAGGTVNAFKPNALWSRITKLKMYTNKITVGSGITVRIARSGFFNYYEKGSGAFFDGQAYQSVQLGGDLMVDTAVAGTAVPNPGGSVVSLNIGDPGTLYGELVIPDFVPVPTNIEYNTTFPTPVTFPTVFGDVYIKDVTIDGTLYEQWFTQYLCVYIVPRCGATSVPFKWQYFLEFA